MEKLLSSDFLSIVNAHRNGTLSVLQSMPQVYYEDCSLPQFDVSDNKNGGTIVQAQGAGQAHYFNSPQVPVRNMRFIAYEKLLDALGEYSKNWKRVDLIAYDTTYKSYFIIHELSTGSFQNKKSDARIQMQNTILRLWESPTIKSYIQSFTNKLCIISATGGIQSSPHNMSGGFNAIYNLIPTPTPVKANIVEKRGFKMWKTMNVILSIVR